MDLASSSIFLALTPLALALPFPLKPLVLPSMGTPPIRTLASIVLGLFGSSTLTDSTVAVRSQPSLQWSSKDRPFVLSTSVWTVCLTCLATAAFNALSKMSLMSHWRATHFGLAMGSPFSRVWYNQHR